MSDLVTCVINLYTIFILLINNYSEQQMVRVGWGEGRVEGLNVTQNLLNCGYASYPMKILTSWMLKEIEGLVFLETD